MNYNKIISALHDWCIEKSEKFYKEYEEAGGTIWIKASTAGELSFKLSMLIDKNFDSVDSLMDAIEAMIDIHYDFGLKHSADETAVTRYQISKIYDQFREYMKLVCAPDAVLPEMKSYERVIVGEEADAIIEKIKNVWGYVNTDYWYPICGNEQDHIPNKAFIMSEYFENEWDKVSELLRCSEKHIYSYGESAYDIPFCMEVDKIEDYSCSEWVYTDKDFTWFIYFCHEDTVAFAGSITELIKETFKDKAEHWNRYEG